MSSFPINTDTNPFISQIKGDSYNDANINNDPIIVKPEILKTNDFSLSKQYSNIIRLVQQNKDSSINWQEKGITLNNAIEALKQEDSIFNTEMKNIVLKHIEKTTNNDEKLTILEKGLAFLETDKNLSKLVSEGKLESETAKESLKKCLNFGCQKDFSLEALNSFNTSLENLNEETVSEEVRKLTESFDIKDNPTVPQQQNEIKKSQNEQSSHNENQTSALDKGSPKTNSTEETVTILENSDKGITSETNKTVDELAKSTFEQLLEYPWENHNSNKANTIKGTIQDLIKGNSGNFDKKLLDSIQKTLEKDLGIDQKTFNQAWAKAISETQGGEVIKNKHVTLKFDGKEVKTQMTFTPQAKMSEFGNDTLKHCSSVYQSSKVGATQHAVNLWRQDIEVEGKQSMSFLRHGYILEQENAAKEILANACALKHGEELIQNTSKDNPLTLNFTNVQLMSFGTIADTDKAWKQMEMFNSLTDESKQPLELNYRGKTIYVEFEPPLLFNFGVNAQHFNHLEIGNSKAKKQAEDQNLESFKKLFGTNFPNNEKKGDDVVFEDGSLIMQYLNSKGADGKQIQMLANQIFDIYKNHPEGLKENPYALPTRVLALTNLLGYASSFNCKSGKDRTGACAMELTNLCAQIKSENKIYNPEDESVEEQQNLQEIYKEGSCVRDIPKVNTVLQTGLKLGSSKHINKRFLVDLTKPFDSNLNKLSQNQAVED